MKSREKAEKAAEYLSKKSGVPWKVKEDKEGNLELSFEGIQDGDRTTFAQKLKSQGIEFNPDTSLTTLRAQKEGKVFDRAFFTHPLEIEFMAENKFEQPELSSEDLIKAAENLSKKTGLKWVSLEDEIAVQVKIEASGHKDAENKLRNQLKESGISILPTIRGRATLPMQAEGRAIVTASFSHPLEVMALARTEIPQKSQELIITPGMAGALYKAVTQSGRGKYLDGLSNEEKPDKFSKALEILDIKVDTIEFNGRNGYIVKMNEENFSKIQGIVNPPPPPREGLSARH